MGGSVSDGVRVPQKVVLASHGCMMVGMIPFANEFVMLDVRPVILTGVGILKALSYAVLAIGALLRIGRSSFLAVCSR